MTEDNCGHARVLADYEEMRLSFHNILDLLMPEEGDALLLPGGPRRPGPGGPQGGPGIVDEADHR